MYPFASKMVLFATLLIFSVAGVSSTDAPGVQKMDSNHLYSPISKNLPATHSQTSSAMIQNDPSPTDSFYDARKMCTGTGFCPVSEVRSQGSCGSDWAFAAVQAYEISYYKINGQCPQLSPQQLIDCLSETTPGGRIRGCNGAWAHDALDKMLGQNMSFVLEQQYPYMGVKQTTCKTDRNMDQRFKIKRWGFANPKAPVPPFGNRNSQDNIQKMFSKTAATASVYDIKNAICKYGSVIAPMRSSDEFRSYRKGVLKERFINTQTPPFGNIHVLIIGWDDSKGAWLVKNFWGSSWGEKGFVWVAYGNFIIESSYPSWVEAVQI